MGWQCGTQILSPAGVGSVKGENMKIRENILRFAAGLTAVLFLAVSVPQSALARPAEEEEGETYTIAFAGDILFDPSYAAGYALTRNGVQGSFDAAALEVMQGADTFILNNEFTYTVRGSRSGKKFTFRTNPAYAAMLPEMGADLVTLGNNHTWDFGETGFLDTLAALDAVKIPYIGAGRTLAEAVRPYVIEAGSMRIAILNATEIERGYPVTRGAGEMSPGVFRCTDPALLYEAIRVADATYDFVIVIPHWGTEGKSIPDSRETMLAAGMKEAGADLIVGGHPHVLQGIAFLGDTPAAYSMGNFLFHSGYQHTGILVAEFQPKEKKLASLRFVPMLSANCHIVTLAGGQKAQALEMMRRLSPQTVIDEEGYILNPAVPAETEAE